MTKYDSSDNAIRASAPARTLRLVTKSDADQSVPFRALRVYVAAADAPATLKVTALDDAGGTNDETLTYPAGVFWEPISVVRVWSTGSTANVIVHGIPV
jgi:hypothetical protein